MHSNSNSNTVENKILSLLVLIIFLPPPPNNYIKNLEIYTESALGMTSTYFSLQLLLELLFADFCI